MENLGTWVYDGGSYTPVAKLTEEDSYTIVQDYLGTPIQALDSKGNVVWDCILDIYGDVLELRGEKCFIPFRFQGQYEDDETGLYYNRFRYYDPKTGNYISQDPIGLAGGLSVYAYVHDSNSLTDVLGLMPIRGGKTAGGMSRSTSNWLTRYGPAAMRDHHLIPQEMLNNKGFMQQLDKLTGGKGAEYLHRQIATITNGLHQSVHTNGWNSYFKKWTTNTNNKFSLKDVQKQIKQMMKDYNIPKSSRNFAKKYGCH